MLQLLPPRASSDYRRPAPQGVVTQLQESRSQHRHSGRCHLLSALSPIRARSSCRIVRVNWGDAKGESRHGRGQILTSTTTTSAANTGNGRGASHSAELCRLTVLSAHSQVDLAVPLRVPLTVVIPGIVDTIVNHSNFNEFDHTTEQFEPVDWTLSKVGRAPLAPTLSLHEHGIRDGELLVLEASDTAAPPPLFDDIMYTVAATDADVYRRWTPVTARIVGSTAALVAALVAALALVLGDTGLIGAVCGGVTSLVLTVAAVVAARVYGDSGSSVTLGCASVPLAFVSGALCVPGTVLSAHLLLGSASAAAVTLICFRLCGAGLAVFTALLVVLLAAVGTFAVTTTLPEARTATVSGAVIAAALIVLTFTARLSMLFARLPLPPVPTPSNPLDDDRDGLPEPELPGLTELAERAGRARSYLTGLIVATSVVALVAAVALAWSWPGQGIVWPNLALAFATAVVLMFRGRTYAGAQQAVPLIAAGISVILVLLGDMAWTHRDHALVVFAITMTVLLLALVLGILAPQNTFSPVMRRAAELLDLAAIAAIVPLICWVSGLFALMRGL